MNKQEKFTPQACKRCLGECPENCACCIYRYCTKKVDEALVFYKFNHMINSLSNAEYYSFNKWFVAYFMLEE